MKKMGRDFTFTHFLVSSEDALPVIFQMMCRIWPKCRLQKSWGGRPTRLSRRAPRGSDNGGGQAVLPSASLQLRCLNSAETQRLRSLEALSAFLKTRSIHKLLLLPTDRLHCLLRRQKEVGSGVSFVLSEMGSVCPRSWKGYLRSPSSAFHYCRQTWCNPFHYMSKLPF